jgi:TPR repeat protein
MAVRRLAALVLVLPLLAGAAPSDRSILAPDPTPPAAVRNDPDSLRARADRGEVQAQIELGLRFGHGWGVPRDGEAAMLWLSRAAKQGSAAANREMGLLLLQGEAVAKEPARGIELLRQAADAGDAPAQAALGASYALGLGVTQDFAAAVNWSRKAAEQGNPTAETNLGEYYEFGRGVGVDPAAAATWYRRAADQNYPRAMVRLGSLQQRGLGLPRDPEAAFALYMRAARDGDRIGQRSVGIAYSQGIGVARDDSEAVGWLTAAAGQGDGTAAFLLAIACEEGHGLPQDHMQSWQWLLRSAEAGDFMAESMVGERWFWGVTAPRRDLAEARRWLEAALATARIEALFHTPDPGSPEARQLASTRLLLGQLLTEGGAGLPDPPRGVALIALAAEQNADAMNELARLYWTGTGVDKDPARAATLFREAAEKGSAPAAFNLAQGLRAGWIPAAQKNPEAEALAWYRRAAALGHVPAWVALGEMLESGAGGVHDEDEAQVWFRLAGAHGEPLGQQHLADGYRTGRLGLPRDPAEALRLYHIAADRGLPGAVFMLGVMAEAGEGQPADTDVALGFYRRAATAEWPAALMRLGDAARDGTLGQPHDDAAAVALYRRAAALGLPPAQANLGWMLEHGRGAPADAAAALEQYRTAAAHGEPFAELRLGQAYRLGELGLLPDDAAALTWYRAAAGHGNVNAMVALGLMLENARDVPAGPAEALGLFRRAAAAGNTAGEVNLALCLWFGRNGAALDRIEAVQHFQLAADRGDATAQYMLAVAYRIGDGVKQDYGKMLDWAHKAAVQGDPDALNLLGSAILTGLDEQDDIPEAVAVLTLAVERTLPMAEVRGQATANLANARNRLTDEQRPKAEERLAAWRALLDAHARGK